ncbi:hypothetical protein D3C81_2237080 [compost metagenome]
MSPLLLLSCMMMRISSSVCAVASSDAGDRRKMRSKIPANPFTTQMKGYMIR